MHNNKKTFSSHTETKRQQHFSWFHPATASLVRAQLQQLHCLRQEACALTSCNVDETYTLLSLCRLARGIHCLLVGALSAADASSLFTPGQGHVSLVRQA